jgi:low affinity Fe/Cu permease
MSLADPKTDEIIISDTEERNIYLGLEQLREQWTDKKLLQQCTLQSVDDYSDIFRNKKELRKTKAGIQSAFR